jgi:hypothetical protein
MEAFFTARANKQAGNNRSMQAVGLVTCVFRLGSLLACKQLSRRRKEERTNKIPIQRRPQRPSHSHSTSSDVVVVVILVEEAPASTDDGEHTAAPAAAAAAAACPSAGS